MKDPSKTKQELIEELFVLKQRLQELEHSESDRKQAEKALRESEGNFRRSLDDSPLGMRISTSRAKTIYVNQAMLDIYGYNSVEEMERMPVKERYTPQSYAEYNIRKEKRERGEFDPSQYEINILRKNGEVRHLQAFRKIILWNGVKQVQIIYQDITERNRSEEDLRKSEERYRTILEDIDEGYFEDDLAGNFTFVNDALCRYLGYSREELIGMNYRQYSDEATAKKSYELFYNIYNTEKPIKRFPGQFISKDGTRHFNEVSASLIRDAKGKPIGFRGISQDVTERKRAEEALRESEEQYRTLVENASDIVLRTNDTGHFAFVNPAALRIMGYEEKELIGRHYLTLYRPDMREEAMKFFGRQFVKGIPNTYSEYPFIIKDGREIWLGQNIQLIVEDGHVVGFQAVARDITERKRAEAEILALSITDQLTGLHNRRGFLSLAGQQLKLAERNKSGMLLFFMDLDGLKWINDTLGHEEGDKALIETADVLKKTFRTSDIIARLGGDEYAALTVDITEAKSELFTTRLQSLIDTRNNQENRRCRLSISVGWSYYDPENPSSFDGLMSSADKLMYEQKQNKKGLLLQAIPLSSGNP